MMLWGCVSATPTEQRRTRAAPGTEAMHQLAWGAGVWQQVVSWGCMSGQGKAWVFSSSMVHALSNLQANEQEPDEPAKE